MGQCNLCNCPKVCEDSDQINFPFFSKLFSPINNNSTILNNTNSQLESIPTRNYNLNLFREETPNQELTTLEQIKLTNQEKKRFETMVRNSNISREKMEITSIKEESIISISNRLFINEIKEIPKKKYITQKLLGVGTYGQVFLVQNKYTKEYFAMKEIPKTAEDLLSDNEIMDEIEILKNLDHPDIVRINEFYNTENSYCIINEYCK